MRDGSTIRIWVVEERRGEGPGDLEAILRQLIAEAGSRFVLLGCKPFWPDFAAEMRSQFTDVVLIHEPCWPDGPWTQELLDLGVAILVATTRQRCERFRVLAEQYPIVLIPTDATLDSLSLAINSVHAARYRHDAWKMQVARLQQRLNDRIIIERAKGLLVQRMGISEEEAYNRLRVLSRRQRRQIRDIAQSLLDTQALFTPGENGGLGTATPPHRPVQHPPGAEGT